MPVLVHTDVVQHFNSRKADIKIFRSIWGNLPTAGWTPSLPISKVALKDKGNRKAIEKTLKKEGKMG